MTSILDRPAPPPDATVRYGPLPEHVIDLRLPAQCPSEPGPSEPGPSERAPLVVLFHGGYWRRKHDRTYLRPMAHALAACGYVVAMPEYRRAGMAEEGWTGTFSDVAAACDRLGELVADYGADLARITWAGHSAGGHLALWAASRPWFAASSPWHGSCDATHVVSLAGVNSLGLCARWNLDDGAAQDLLGGGPDDVPERYAVADPAALTPPAVPVTLVHGTADDRVPVGMSRATGIGRLIELPGAGHFDLVDPHSPYWPRVLAAITGNI